MSRRLRQRIARRRTRNRCWYYSPPQWDVALTRWIIWRIDEP